MFQRAIRVNPIGTDYMMSDTFVQECFVGYKYGSYYKLGLVCERTKPEDYPQEESKEEDSMDVDETSDV